MTFPSLREAPRVRNSRISSISNHTFQQVVKTQATEEMFQQKVEVEESNTATVYDSKFSEW